MYIIIKEGMQIKERIFFFFNYNSYADRLLPRKEIEQPISHHLWVSLQLASLRQEVEFSMLIF